MSNGPRPVRYADDRIDAGSSTERSAAVAAIRSRSSNRARAAGEKAVGNLTSITPGSDLISTGNPLSRNTLIIWRFSGSTSAVNSRMPAASACSARCASRTVEMPVSCSSSATANATSPWSPSAAPYIA